MSGRIQPLSSREEVLRFIRDRGIVLECAKGPMPNLAEAIAGRPIRGSWWSHSEGRRIFALTRFVRESPDVLVCRLFENKITYVHRRLWAALICLGAELGFRKLGAIREEHTAEGKHRVTLTPFPRWAPRKVRVAASRLSKQQAHARLGAALAGATLVKSRTRRASRSP